MNCNLDCATCPYAAVEAAERKVIVVSVVGDAIPGAGLGFAGAPMRTIQFGGYSVRLINFEGEFTHVGRKVILSHPDVVLNIVDSMTLEKSLRLTSKLIDMDSRVIMAFSRYDELLATGHSLDMKTMGELFGFPATAFEEGEEGLSRLLSMIVNCYENPFNLKKHVHISYGPDADEAIGRITELVAESPALSSAYHDRYIAVQMLEDPEYLVPQLEKDEMYARISEMAAKESRWLQRAFGRTTAELVGTARDGFIAGALQETLRHSKDSSDHTLTQKVDAVLTNKWLGLPLLILILFGVFEATFALGAYPQRWIENGIALLGDFLDRKSVV